MSGLHLGNLWYGQLLLDVHWSTLFMHPGSGRRGASNDRDTERIAHITPPGQVQMLASADLTQIGRCGISWLCHEMTQ